MYRALVAFLDGEHGRPFHPTSGGVMYAAGSPYPQEGVTVSEEHIAYLLGDQNRLGHPVIELVSPTAAYDCPHCEKVYKSEAALTKHITEKHTPTEE